MLASVRQAAAAAMRIRLCLAVAAACFAAGCLAAVPTSGPVRGNFRLLPAPARLARSAYLAGVSLQ